jgi:hypothetical protein
VRPGSYPADAIGHALGELCDRLVANGREQRIPVGEVPVGGVRNDPDHARDLAQHDRLWTAGPRELNTGFDER